MRFMRILLGFVGDQIAVNRELADHGIDLAKRELRAALQPAPEEAVGIGVYPALQGGGATVVCQHGAVLFSQREDALNATDRHHTVAAVHILAERSDVRAGSFAAGQQACGRGERVGRLVLVADAVKAALLMEMLSQEVASAGIEQAHRAVVPLHVDVAANPARRSAVIGGVYLDAAVQVHAAFAELVEAERFQG
jgi:hypothetical protein